METIKCKKCGCEMSAMSESCPLCGTPTRKVEEKVSTEPVNKSTSKKKKEAKTEQIAVLKDEVSQPIVGGYTRLPDVKISDSLINILGDHVNALHSNPQYSCTLMANSVDGGIANHIVGEDYFIGTTNTLTNRANLYFFITVKTEEEKTRFMALENSRLYQLEYGDSYSVECGEDVEKCAYLFSEIVQKVWDAPNDIEFEDFGERLTFENVMLYLNDNKVVWDKLSQMTKVYNTEAKANKYPQFELVASERLLKGQLPSYLNKGNILSKTHKIFKKMKKEFESIIEFAIKNLEE